MIIFAKKNKTILKLTREIKTAILVIAAILLFIWGYSFLKGRDLFTNYKTFYVEYQNVEGLPVSAPVTINGLTIGKVSSIKMQKNWKSVVEMQINNDYEFSKNSLAEIYAPSPIGGRQIAILPSTDGGAIAQNGDFLKSSSKLGLTDALALQIEPLKDKIDKVLVSANTMLANINDVLDAKSKENLKNSLANLNVVLSDFKTTSSSLNGILGDSKSKIGNTLSNAEKATSNFVKVSDSLTKLNLSKTVATLDKTLSNVNGIMANIDAGKGTMGKLVKDEQMYNNLSKASKELELLLQDLRLNPTRYVNVSLFGKKNKPYTAPINDTLKK